MKGDAALRSVLHQDYRLSPTAPVYAMCTAPTGHGVGLHVHAHQGLELGIVTAGQAEWHVGGSLHALGPAEVYLCRSWEPHGWGDHLPGTETVAVIFLPSWLGYERFGTVPWLGLFSARAPYRPSVATAEGRARLLDIGRDMAHEIADRPPAWESALRLQVLRVLLELSRCWRTPASAEGTSRVSPDDLARLMPVLDLVQSNPSRRLTLGKAADLCNWSRPQFCRVFRRVMGTTFGEFDLQARLGFAERLLVQTTDSVETIAQSTGFASASHLHRSFVKQYGSTPGRYRRAVSPA